MATSYGPILSHSQLFRSISLPMLEELVQLGKIEKFETGSLLLEEGNRVRGLFILLEGAVEVVKRSQTMLTQLGRGNFFGEISVFGMAFEATASIRARQATTVLMLSQAQLAIWFKKHPDAELVFLRHLALELCQRLYATTEQVSPS